jgi:hypothetical protein
MKEHLSSVCFGNWRGYRGTKEEIPAMMEQCKKDCEREMGKHSSSYSDLLYAEKKIDNIKPDKDGLYTIEYWSKW